MDNKIALIISITLLLLWIVCIPDTELKAIPDAYNEFNIEEVITPTLEQEKPIECNFEKIVTHVTLTTYNPVESQCDDTPLITANMTKIDLDKLKSGEQRIVAISRDLLYMIPLGSKVHIEGHGEYIVADVMNKRFTHRMDILQSVGEPNFKKDKVKITYWKYNG